ncbi:MAG: 2TM domain-containing protein [Pseudomonadota bacterium]
MDKKQAKKRIEDLKGFYAHLTAYIASNVLILVINLMLVPDFLFFIFPLLGWGIGVAVHAMTVFGTGRDWEARKMEELMGLNETKQEVHRLTERADALITILASVDWAKIDPELLKTKATLEDAREKIVAFQNGQAQDSAEDVTREIEKLEEFVTSSKFAFFEKAAK